MDYPAAIGAGVLSGSIMAAILYMGIAMMPSQMKMNLFNLLGTMMFREKVMVYMAGAMIHGVMSVAFAFAHVGIYQAFDIASSLAAWGLLFGFVHFVVSGMALGMVPMMHPGVRSGVVQAPGMFALSYPSATAMGFLMLHVLFGVLVGVSYDAFGGV
jgi:hypothetical protein